MMQDLREGAEGHYFNESDDSDRKKEKRKAMRDKKGLYKQTIEEED
jgi:hypothetical protein